MSPTKKFSVWVTAIALLVAMVLTPIAAGAKPPASKVWNIYQDKLGAYSVTSAVPKGQTFIEGPFTTQAEATAALTQPPVIDYTLNPASPDGANGWYSSGTIGLTWNVFVPGSPGKSLVVTGDGNQTVSTDGTFTFTKSATAVGGSVGPVNVTIKRDVTDPALNLGTSIVNNDSFEVGSVPAEPTFNPQDATSGLDSSSLTGYDVAVGAHTLIATATDLAGNMIQQQVGYTVTPHQAQVLAPVAADETFNSPGVANLGSITIPTVAGVDYFIDGVLASGGANSLFAGNYQVTAAPQSQDYEMVGYPSGGWALTIAAADVTVPVTTQAPVAFDETVNLSGGITIPQVTGVNYFIDGNPASAGDNLLPNGAHLVTVEAQPFYVLNGDVSWNLTINAYVPPIIDATALAPVVVDPTTVGGMGSIEVLAVTGVDYFVDGNHVSGVTPFAPGNYQVTAAPQAGYALVGDTSWPVTINEFVPPIIEVTPAAPTATDQGNGVSGFITIPTSEGIDYALEGTAVAAGNYDRDPGTYAVAAQAQPGYALVGQTSWNLTINPYVPPKQVQFVGRTVGIQAGTSVALPEGWEPGDLAVVMVMKNGNSTSVPATVPGFPLQAGWSRLTVGPTTASTNAQVASGLFTKVLTATDVAPTWSSGFRGAVMLVYRNATLGAVLGQGGTSTSVTFAGLALQNNTGSSWVGAMAGTFTGMRDAAAPTGMVSRTAGGGGGAAVGGFDTNGGVTSFASRSIPASSVPWNAFSFELKVTP